MTRALVMPVALIALVVIGCAPSKPAVPPSPPAPQPQAAAPPAQPAPPQATAPAASAPAPSPAPRTAPPPVAAAPPAPAAAAPTPAPSGPAAVPAPKILYVKTHLANFREGTGTNAKILRVLRQGARLQVLEAKSDWFRVRLDDNQEGWVAESVTSTTAP